MTEDSKKKNLKSVKVTLLHYELNLMEIYQKWWKKWGRYQMMEASVERYLAIEGLLQLLLQGVMAMQINMFIQRIESEN